MDYQPPAGGPAARPEDVTSPPPPPIRPVWRRALPDDDATRALFLGMAAAALTAGLSIAASQFFLAVTVAAYLYHYFYGDPPRYHLPPPWRPVLVFMLLTTLAVLWSPDLAVSLKATKKFFLFLVMFFVFNAFRSYAQVDLLYRGLFATAAVASLVGILQFPSSTPEHRITGTLGHWMTFSGIELIFFTALLAYLLYGGRRAFWALPIFLLTGGALLLSLTRSAWIGALCAAGTVLALKRPRRLVLLPLAALALLFLSPHRILERAKTLLTLEDQAITVRFNMIRTGLEIIKQHPLLGVGPNRISRVAYAYGGDRSVAPAYYVHLHNNVLQIAAERGIPCLLAWLWLIARLFRDYFRMARRTPFTDPRSYPLVVAIAALVGILVAGLFEYNFGDSEVMMLLLFVLTAPYVVDREVMGGGLRVAG